MASPDMSRPINLASFRLAFGGIPMPVALVGTVEGEEPHATTVSSFCSLSADPPLLLVALDERSNTLASVLRTGRFALNVLSVGQERLALTCATKALGKLDAFEWERQDGLPRITGAVVWMACSLIENRLGGDHRVLIGLINDSAIAEGKAMLYHRRQFTTLAP